MQNKKILITGFSGFVARYFLQYLYNENIYAEVCGIDIKDPDYHYESYHDKLSIQFHKVNLLETSDLNALFLKFVPDYILHLASFSSVAYSWKNPVESFRNNTNIFLNLVMCVKEVNPQCRILSIGSSEEYGNVEESDLPLTETKIPNPNSPYAVARVSQEMLSKLFSESYGMKIIMTRSFNHIGPYQDERFVVPSFIRRILDISESGKTQGSIETGDTTIIRDFVDVRDVVKAYYLLLKDGIPGEVYNICSGRGISLQSIIDEVASYLHVHITTNVNPQFVRPNDIKKIIGSSDKIKRKLEWTSQVPLQVTLQDMVECMRSK